MDLREIGWEVVDWMHLAQEGGKVAGCCENGNETSGYIKGGEFFVWVTTSFSRWTLLHGIIFCTTLLPPVYDFRSAIT
jgi:hypothetical protein